MIDGEAKVDFIRWMFEYLFNIKPSFVDLWKIYIKFVEKNFANTSIKKKTLRRAVRCIANDHHLTTQILFDAFREAQPDGDVEKLRSNYTELANRFKENTSHFLKISETYFKLLINLTVNKKKGTETTESDLIDDLEYLKATVDYFAKTFDDKKELNFSDRKGLSGIYRAYLSLMMRVDRDDIEKEAVIDVCEKLVKLSGNEADSWLTYIAFLKHVHDLNTRDPIRAIYKRAIRFCNGDLSKIFDDFKEFEMIFGDNLDEIAKAEDLYKSIQNAANTSSKNENKPKNRVEIQNMISEKQSHKLKNMETIYEKQENRI